MTVKVFRSTDYGAPVNNNAVGSLIAILDACLINGYGSQTVTSITRSGTTATVTLPVAHALQNDTFVSIAGATQTDYNGDFPITVTSATTFTYQVANSPATPATGTITSKVAPTNWTKPFSGTGLAAYKQGAGSNGMYLRVDNSFTVSAGSHPKVVAYTAMTDVNTGDNATPECNFPVWFTTGTQPWMIIANEKGIYLIMNTNSTVGNYSIGFFGDFVSKKSGDLFNTILTTCSNYYDDQTFFSLSSSGLSAANKSYVMRAYSQSGGAVAFGKKSLLGDSSANLGTLAQPYPSPIDNSVHLSPVLITESAGIRGVFPALWNPLHNRPFASGDIIIGSGEFTGKKFMAFSSNAGGAGQCLIEISNTW